MAASGTNILRWSALFGGVAYGFYHQSSIRAADRVAEVDRKYKHQQSMIEKARAEYTKKTLPPSKLTAGGDVISDPNDPKFDLEAFLKIKEAEMSDAKA